MSICVLMIPVILEMILEIHFLQKAADYNICEQMKKDQNFQLNIVSSKKFQRLER